MITPGDAEQSRTTSDRILMRSKAVRQLGYFLLGLAMIVAVADAGTDNPGTLFALALTMSIAGAALSLHRGPEGDDAD